MTSLWDVASFGLQTCLHVGGSGGVGGGLGMLSHVFGSQFFVFYYLTVLCLLSLLDLLPSLGSLQASLMMAGGAPGLVCNIYPLSLIIKLYT